jgi:O-Antigen ligase.
VLLVLMLVAAAGAAWTRRVEVEGRTRLGRLPLPVGAPLIAAVIALGLIVIPIAAAGSSHGPAPTPQFGETSQRLSSTGSNRYAYWKVALRTFADEPLRGVGSGGFATEWLQRRTITEVVRDAHSLYIETLAELGIVGLLLLGLALGAVAACARAVYRVDPALAAGPIAALTAFGLHAGIDWDWEMPALTLVAISLAGVLLSRAAARSAD